MVKAAKQGEYHWDKGAVSWSPAPPRKKKKPKKKQKNSIQLLREKNRRLEDLIDQM